MTEMENHISAFKESQSFEKIIHLYEFIPKVGKVFSAIDDKWA